jgi:hypothetical protein
LFIVAKDTEQRDIIKLQINEPDLLWGVIRSGFEKPTSGFAEPIVDVAQASVIGRENSDNQSCGCLGLMHFGFLANIHCHQA